MGTPQWAIIYDNGKVYTNLDGTWEDAPAYGAQVIVYQNPETGWSIVTSGEHFTQLPDGTFLSLGRGGLEDYAANVWKKIKVGRMLSRPEYNQAMKLAGEIMLSVTKTGYFKNERQV